MKLSDFLPDRKDYLGHIAYLVVVITAYITTFTYVPSLLKSPQLPVFLVIGVIYIILGCYWRKGFQQSHNNQDTTL